MAAAATAKAAPARAPRRAPSRRAPARRRPAPSRRHGGQLIPIAVGTAAAVRDLPDSNVIVRLTQGRAWIGVLGVLLAGIVALNVVTLSLAAQSGGIEQNVQALREENSILRSRDAQLSGASRVRHDAVALGLSAAAVEEVGAVRAGSRDARVAAQRLAAVAAGY
jgi:hypothetical protein